MIHDFTTGPFRPDDTFDLVWSCEFVEHVEEKFLANFLETFSVAGRFLMMTYAPPGQPGWHHVNCRDESYWTGKLKTIGFQLDRDLTNRARTIAGSGHYSAKGLFFSA